MLWLATENDMAITLQRMRDWKIPLDRLLLPFKIDPLRAVNLMDGEHLKLIEALVNAHRTPLVVVDSLRGSHDGDENCSRVGAVLQSIAAIAERTKAAAVIVHHTRKLAARRRYRAETPPEAATPSWPSCGSQIGIDRPDPQSKWCRVRVLKENLGLAPKPVGFRVTKDGLEIGPARQERPRRKLNRTEQLSFC